MNEKRDGQERSSSTRAATAVASARLSQFVSKREFRNGVPVTESIGCDWGKRSRRRSLKWTGF